MRFDLSKYSGSDDLAQRPSVWVIVFTLCFSYWLVDFFRPNNIYEGKHNFHKDVFGYYSYLPATFLNHGSFDWPMDLANDNPYGPRKTHVPKYTYGMSVMYAPFFALACKVAYNQRNKMDGFSEAFGEMVHWGSIFYVILGMIFLRSFLRFYFNETVTAITLLACLYGTILFNYSFVQSELPHGYLFCLFSVFLYLTHKWHQTPKFKYAFWLGFVGGLIALIRLTDTYIFIFFILWNVHDRTSFRTKWQLLIFKYKHILVILSIACLWWLPQLIFNNIHTGSFFYFSHMREGFFWTDPQIANILLSYRNGWIIYTPLIVLTFVGFFLVKKEFPIFKWTFLAVTVLIVYIFSCWEDENYGGNFGARSFCEAIAWLSATLAFVIEKVLYTQKINFLNGVARLATILFILSCICLNVFQTIQARDGKINPRAMTKDAYWITFKTFKYSDSTNAQYRRSLKEPEIVKFSDGTERIK